MIYFQQINPGARGISRAIPSPKCPTKRDNWEHEHPAFRNDVRCKWDRVRESCSPKDCEYRGLQSFSRSVNVRCGEAPEGAHALMRHDTMKKHMPLQIPSLPYPFPPCAFGRIWLDDRLSSTSVRLESTNDGFSVSEEEPGAVYASSAKAVVPLQMLCSRQKEFSEIGGGKSFLALQVLLQALKVALR